MHYSYTLLQLIRHVFSKWVATSRHLALADSTTPNVIPTTFPMGCAASVKRESRSATYAMEMEGTFEDICAWELKPADSW